MQLIIVTLLWRHIEPNGVSNHWHLNGLLNRLFRCESKKTPKFRVTGLCEWDPLVTSGFPSQTAGSVTQETVPFDDVIMLSSQTTQNGMPIDCPRGKSNLCCTSAIVDLTTIPSNFNLKLIPPSAAYMRQWTLSALVQVMACHLLGAKPLPEPILTYCQ